MMQKTKIVKGRLTGPKTVELNEPVLDSSVEVDVLIHPSTNGKQNLNLSDYLKTLPAGTRTKEDVDQQIRSERDSWGDR